MLAHTLTITLWAMYRDHDTIGQSIRLLLLRIPMNANEGERDGNAYNHHTDPVYEFTSSRREPRSNPSFLRVNAGDIHWHMVLHNRPSHNLLWMSIHSSRIIETGISPSKAILAGPSR